MKAVRLFTWSILVGMGLFIAWGGLHFSVGSLLGALDVEPNAATAGGYTMEVIVSLTVGLIVMSRLILALAETHSLSNAFRLLVSRTASLAIFLGALIAMGFANRIFWWVKHMFTNEAFHHPNYVGAGNAIALSLILCGFIYALAPEERRIDGPQSLPNGLPLALFVWTIGVLSFIAGVLLYQGPF